VDGVHDTWRAGGDVHDGAQRDEDGARGRGAVQLRLSMQRSEAGDELAADTAVVRVALAPRSTRAPRASAGVLEASPAAAVQPAATAEPAAKSPRPAAAPRGPTLYRTVQPVAPAASQPASSARAAASEDAHAAQPEATVQPEPTANAQSASGERAATMDAQNSQPGASVEAEAALAPGGEVAPLVQLEPPRAEQLDSGSPNPTAQALGAAGDGSR
jgi:FtsZ-interacting cell division protein ZipA